MRLTRRERNVWLFVGLAVLFMLGYNFFAQMNLTEVQPTVEVSLSEARRLLAAETNIETRYQAVQGRLRQLQGRFLKSTRPEDQRIELLEAVEAVIAKSGLSVERKNVIDFRDGVLGVSLEGTATAETVISFMHQTASSPLGLRLKRVQLMANPELKTLKYQLIVVTKLLNETGETHER